MESIAGGQGLSGGSKFPKKISTFTGTLNFPLPKDRGREQVPLRLSLPGTTEHYENRLCDIFGAAALLPRIRIPDSGPRAIEKLQGRIRSNPAALRRGNREPVETFREAFEKPGILFKVKARGRLESQHIAHM